MLLIITTAIYKSKETVFHTPQGVLQFSAFILHMLKMIHLMFFFKSLFYYSLTLQGHKVFFLPLNKKKDNCMKTMHT